jgi:hypothetical protein
VFTNTQADDMRIHVAEHPVFGRVIIKIISSKRARSEINALLHAHLSYAFFFSFFSPPIPFVFMQVAELMPTVMMTKLVAKNL